MQVRSLYFLIRFFFCSGKESDCGNEQKFYQRTDFTGSAEIRAAGACGAVSAGAVRRGGSAGGRPVRNGGRCFRGGDIQSADAACNRGDDRAGHGHYHRHRARRRQQSGGQSRKSRRKRCHAVSCIFSHSDASASSADQADASPDENPVSGIPAGMLVYTDLRSRRGVHRILQCSGQHSARHRRFPDTADGRCLRGGSEYWRRPAAGGSIPHGCVRRCNCHGFCSGRKRGLLPPGAAGKKVSRFRCAVQISGRRAGLRAKFSGSVFRLRCRTAWSMSLSLSSTRL